MDTSTEYARTHSLACRSGTAFLRLGGEIDSLPQKFAIHLLFVVRVWIMNAEACVDTSLILTVF